MRAIRTLIAGVMAVGGAALLAAGLVPGDGPEPARASTNHVVNIVTGGTFSPSTITIAPGDTVTFVNTSSTVANAISQLGGTDPNFFQTDTFVYAGAQSCARKSTSPTCWTFPNTGTFTYQNNMQDPKPTGTIIVVSGGGGGGDPTNPPPATNTPTKTPTPIPTATSPGSGGGSPTSTPTKTPTPLPTATTPSGGSGGGGSPTNTPTLLPTPLPTATSPGGGGSGSPTNTPTLPPTATAVPTQEAGNQTGFGNLGPGWNLVVYYGPTMATSQAVQGIPSNYSVIYHWHGTGYSRYVKPGMAPPWVSTLHMIQDGQVYWVYIQ